MHWIFALGLLFLISVIASSFTIQYPRASLIPRRLITRNIPVGIRETMLMEGYDENDSGGGGGGDEGGGGRPPFNPDFALPLILYDVVLLLNLSVSIKLWVFHDVTLVPPFAGLNEAFVEVRWPFVEAKGFLRLTGPSISRRRRAAASQLLGWQRQLGQTFTILLTSSIRTG